MQHLDEYIIELYVLKSKEVENMTSEIEKHLNECFGCREIYDSLKEFYQSIEGQYSILNRKKYLDTSQIVIQPYYNKNRSIAPASFLEKSIYLVRTQPIKSALSLVAAIAIFILGMNYKVIFSDRNPSDVRINDRVRELEVLNKEGEKIFSYLYDIVEDTVNKLGMYEQENNIRYSVVYDLDKDGKNEIITSIPYLIKYGRKKNAVTIIKDEGKNYIQNTIGDTCSVPKLPPYDNDYVTRGIIVDDFDADGEPEIYVGASQRRSPFVLTKFDSKLNKVGEYWHYGTMWGINEIIWNGKKRIILTGVNDKNEPKSEASFVIIDPTLIKNKVQSEYPGNFRGISIIKQEIYKTIPWTKYNDEIGEGKPRIMQLLKASRGELKLGYLFNYNSKYTLEITIDSSSRIKSIAPNDNFIKKFGFADSKLISAFTKDSFNQKIN